MHGIRFVIPKIIPFLMYKEAMSRAQLAKALALSKNDVPKHANPLTIGHRRCGSVTVVQSSKSYILNDTRMRVMILIIVENV